jgi:hypothetical protein
MPYVVGCCRGCLVVSQLLTLVIVIVGLLLTRLLDTLILIGISYVQVVIYANASKHDCSTSRRSIPGYHINILGESYG